MNSIKSAMGMWDEGLGIMTEEDDNESCNSAGKSSRSPSLFDGSEFEVADCDHHNSLSNRMWKQHI